MIGLQSSKVVSNGYALLVTDLGYVIYAMGAIVLPFGFSAGFYATIVNARGGTVQFTTPGASFLSASQNTALTTIYSSVTVLRTPGNDWLGVGMP